MRSSFSAAIVFAIGACAAMRSAAFATAGTDVCRPEYVVPYAEQCDFNYHNVHKDQSISNVANAYDSCARAQAVAVVCVKSPDRQVRAVSTSALYRDVGEQAEIALFAQHFPLAEALLREKRDVLRVFAMSRPKADSELARESASIASDLRDAKTGECTAAALASARDQIQLGHDRKYAELATLLLVKSRAYVACAPLATTPAKAAYVRFEALVALEESGRAAQAAGETDESKDRYAQCLTETNDASRDASKAVEGYLATVHYLCKGRMLGKYPVDKPEPLDRDAGSNFEPLGMPR